MNEQLSFFKEPLRQADKYNLFLGIFPDFYTAQQIIKLANALRQKHGLHGQVRPASHLHVSLFFLGSTDDVPASTVKAVDRVCKPVAATTRPFEIRFDRVFSFHGRVGNHPLVLVGDEQGNTGIRNLQRSLAATFLKHPISTRGFTPHLTLLYNHLELAPAPVEPFVWTAKEIILVRSEVGATKYHPLGSWILG